MLQKVRQEGEKALNDDGSEVQKQIMMHFSKLHGLLQLQEDSILEQLKRAQRQTTDSLVSIGIGLEENIQVRRLFISLLLLVYTQLKYL